MGALYNSKGSRRIIPGGKELLRLYPSRGDATLAGTVNLPSTPNGPIQVTRFRNLILNGANVTWANPNRGGLLVCDTLTTTGTASTIHMNGKGCAGEDWENYDLTIPSAIEITSRLSDSRTFLQRLISNGWFLGDPLLWPFGVADGAPYTASFTPGANKIVDKAQLGAAGPQTSGPGSCGASYCLKGGDGGAGAVGPGGGSSGIYSVNDNYTTLYIGAGEVGRSWRGGFAGTGQNGGWTNALRGAIARQNGPGGLLVVIVLSAVTLGVGLTLSANAIQDLQWHANGAAIGGNGGGRVLLLSPSIVSSNLTLTATGSEGTRGGLCTGTCSAKGGAGAATQSTLSTWGLA